MVIARPTYKILATSRLGASNPSIQNMKRGCGDIFTHPQGTIFLRTDSGQIEPRISWSWFFPDPVVKLLIIAYNDAYWGLVHYLYMSKEEYSEVLKHRDVSKIVLRTDMPVERRNDMKTILLAGTYQSGLATVDPELAYLFKAKVIGNVLYKRVEERVAEEVRSGQTTFFSVFGTPITPDQEKSTKYGGNSVAWYNHLERCGMNNPIQATASDLMCVSVKEADEIISHAKSRLTNICYYKHDEGAFIIDEKDSKLVEPLKDVVAYQVDDWIPIFAESFIGVKPSKITDCLPS
jgi:hypothetical protein